MFSEKDVDTFNTYSPYCLTQLIILDIFVVATFLGSVQHHTHLQPLSTCYVALCRWCV